MSSWSIGTKTTETSILNAYLDAVTNAKHYIYIENQFFITYSGDKTYQSTSSLDSPLVSSSNQEVFNQIGQAIYLRIIRAFRNKETFRVFILFPLLPAFEGNLIVNFCLIMFEFSR